MSELHINKDVLKRINKEGISIIIGARNEYPQIAMTIANLMENMHATGITKWEIILMDNGSTDETSRFFLYKREKGTNTAQEKAGKGSYLRSPRGLVNDGRLRIFFDPVYSNVGTRNKGVLKAKYENIIFSDAHQIIRLGTIYYTIETLIKNSGIVHAPIAWMGASSERPMAGYQYSYKVGEKIWGTWNKVKVSENPFYIPICGHAFLAVRRKQFLKYRGYPYAQRVYGGGEPYLDTKYWMLGSTSMMDPRGLVYHLSAGRGYSWHNNDLIHNMFLVSYIMGGIEWADRILITYLNKHVGHEDFYRALYAQALRDGQEDKDWLDKYKKFTFQQVIGVDKTPLVDTMSKEELEKQPWWCTKCTKRGYPDPHVMRPWDVRNQKKHKTHRSWVAEFKLRRDDGKVFIGNTEIVAPQALEIADKYV